MKRIARDERPKSVEAKAGPGAPLVLYVEDDPDNWLVAELSLGKRFRLEWARTDADACAAVRRHGGELAAVLMDIELRDSKLSGLDLARVIRGKALESPPPDYAQNLPQVQVPIFFVTAFSARYNESDALRSGGDRILYKPVNFGELSLALSTTQLRQVSPAALQLLTAIRSAASGGSPDWGAVSPALTQRWLALAGYVGGQTEVSSTLAEELERIGPSAALALAHGLAVLELVPTTGEGEVLLANLLRRAVASALVAERLHLPKLAAFTTGLLLEGGLAARAAHDFHGALEVCRGPAGVRPLRERSAGEIEHPRRGAEMLAALGVEAPLVEAVAHHHASEPGESAESQAGWLAERMAAVFETGNHLRLVGLATRAAEKLGIDQATCRRILEAVPGEVQVLGRRLGRPVSAQPGLEELLRESTRSLVALDDSYRELVDRLESLVSEKDALLQRLTQARDELAARAATDELTGIANHRALLTAARRDCSLAARVEQPVSLVMVDVDHFKRINDMHGHPAGDEVLRQIASILASSVRSGDLAARYGGEEFALLLPHTEAASALRVAERIRAAIEARRIDLGGVERTVTASFGVAAMDKHRGYFSVEELVRQADAALYQAKHAGRNRVQVAEHTLKTAKPV